MTREKFDRKLNELIERWEIPPETVSDIQKVADKIISESNRWRKRKTQYHIVDWYIHEIQAGRNPYE